VERRGHQVRRRRLALSPQFADCASFSPHACRCAAPAVAWISVVLTPACSTDNTVPAVPNGASASSSTDSVESVRETLRRADEALKKANQPGTGNGFVVPAAPGVREQETWRRSSESLPAADVSFGGVSHVLGDAASPTFRTPISPEIRSAVFS